MNKSESFVTRQEVENLMELTRFHFGRLNLSPPALSGIACIALSFVDAHGRPLQVPVQDCAASQRSENCTIPLHPDHFDELTTVGKVDSINLSSGTGEHSTEQM